MSDEGLKRSLYVIILAYAYLPKREVFRCLKAIIRDIDRHAPRGATRLRTLSRALAGGRARTAKDALPTRSKTARLALRQACTRALSLIRDTLEPLQALTPVARRLAVRLARVPIMRRRVSSATTHATTRA